MDTTRNVAEAVAARLGGVAGIGLEVHSDADLADAVANGFRVKSIDALRDGGVTEAEVGSLIIKARTLSHRRASGGRLTADESVTRHAWREVWCLQREPSPAGTRRVDGCIGTRPRSAIESRWT